MKIPIKKGEGDVPEWQLVELQGELELRQGDETRMREEGFEVGRCKGDAGKSVTLTVANPELVGNAAPLRKPLVVLERVVSDAGDVQFQVRGVLREKLAFVKPPRILVSKAE